jgi:RNase adaptor protein for sRNA GlmZ degradation
MLGADPCSFYEVARLVLSVLSAVTSVATLVVAWTVRRHYLRRFRLPTLLSELEPHLTTLNTTKSKIDYLDAVENLIAIHEDIRRMMPLVGAGDLRDKIAEMLNSLRNLRSTERRKDRFAAIAKISALRKQLAHRSWEENFK